ncbi:MAG: NAD(P)-dependent dehydrogenase (short-subunit alcohol dehydrogenase family) [Flavobacteriales bacterium]|jgi:NAD(P)-dependent dehydrogenase (short-subunit alcohol dehydrogenase family)
MSNVILVTGGSSGIGKSIASYLTSKGHTVYGTSRSAEEGITSEGFYMLRMDVTDEANVVLGVNSILKKEGRLDVLVNNAGLGMAGPLENTSSEELEGIFQTNVFGVMNVCRVAIPALRKSKGKIINITSIGGIFALPYRGVYCASKFAIEGFSESLSMELLPQGIDVSIVQPGDVKTNINANRHISENVNRTVYPKFDRVLEQINNEVREAQDPILVAKTIEKIIGAKTPKLRYRVAPLKQKISLILHWMLPGKTFEKLISRFYGLRKPKT